MIRFRYIFSLFICVTVLLNIAIAQPFNHASECATSGTDLSVGQTRQVIRSGGAERRYLLYVPKTYQPDQAAPLVISFHGFASTPRLQSRISDWNAVADKHGFIVVYPQGTGFPLRWNSGETQLRARAVDDVAFARDLIAQLSKILCIDQRRVYANGLSNGGGMSNRLACELSDQIAAIGSVAGTYNSFADGCRPLRPVPVIAFHGTADPIVPYEGGEAGGFVLPPVQLWAKEWARRNQCALAPERLPPDGDVQGLRYTDCADQADVILYTIEDGGHTWPGSDADLPEIVAGKTSQNINATEAMWKFFRRYTLATP